MSAVAQNHSNRLAIVALDRTLLANTIGLPPETQIVNAFIDLGKLEVYFVVESPDLPEVQEGHRPPLANPVIKTEFDWGLKHGS